MIWLSTSLFCCKTEWNKLFADGIIPFLADPITNNYLDTYTIEFNYLSGENIRLSLFTTEASAPQLAKHTDKYFKNYFLNANFFAPEIKLPVNGIFIPFPVNTIQYGLYPPQTIINSEKENYSLSISLSQIILNALKDDTIDDETIVTFAFYLQISLIKCINDIYSESVDILKSVYKNIIYDNGIIDTDIIKAKFEDSKEMLAEITQDLMADKSHENIPEWLEIWIGSCRAEIKKYKNIQTDDIKTIYRKIVYLTIHKHLAITPPMNLMLSYFIEHILF